MAVDRRDLRSHPKHVAGPDGCNAPTAPGQTADRSKYDGKSHRFESGFLLRLLVLVILLDHEQLPYEPEPIHQQVEHQVPSCRVRDKETVN